jgi:predicted DNA-binding transcriptional regulator YafY
VVREDHLPALVRRLQRRGLAPRVEFLLPGVRSAARRFDQASLAYFYLALRLCHQLSELIPSAYRAPRCASLLLDLEKQLGERDCDLAAQLADEAAQRILNPPASRLLSTGDHVPGPAAETIALIERAIQTGAPLEIVYYSPYRDEVTTRVIEPHRVEWRGRTPYLTPALRAGASVAYCQLDQDERTFRVDRIRECRVSNGE